MGDFDIGNESFENWFLQNKPEFEALWRKVNQKYNRAIDETAFLNDLATDLSDAKGQASAWAIQAEDFYNDFLAKESEKVKVEFPNAAPNTLLQYAGKVKCQEKRVYNLFIAMLKTIELRASLCQTKLRFLKGE